VALAQNARDAAFLRRLDKEPRMILELFDTK
jgi:hypothetical protein